MPYFFIAIPMFLFGACMAQTVPTASNNIEEADTIICISDQLDSLAHSEVIVPILVENFEDSSFTDHAICSGNCPVVLQEDGNSFMRAKLSGKMKVVHRSEVSFGKSAPLELNLNYLIYFKVRYLADSAGIFPKGIFMQIHAKKTKTQKTDPNIVSWQSLVGRVDKGGDSGYWEGEKVDSKRRLNRVDLNQDTWQECVALVRLSAESDGVLTVYRNGIKEFDAQGANSAAWMTSQFLKMGIYSAHNSGKKAKYGQTSMAYRRTDFDDVRIYMVSENEVDQSLETLLGL
ncbi:MAG: hypothetical protein ACI9FU_001026 [Granulosicoccus sp.]|jgi:hypothetical protein